MTREQYENWKRERALAAKRRRRKITTIVVAMMLIVGTAIGTTVAWLTDTTETVTDTFTYGDVDIELYEGDSGTTKWSANASTRVNKVIPGDEISFNPYLWVDGKSEDCYLFVKIVEVGDFDTYMTYEIGENWAEISNEHPGVYYYEENANKYHTNTGDEYILIIDGNNLTVKDSVTKELVGTAGWKNPNITITAYAVQRANINSVEEAWKIAENNGHPIS